MTAPAGDAAVRARVRVLGRVQGVFFRAATAEVARENRLNGWVRNLPDNSVEAEFEGSHRNVEVVIEWCRRGPPAAHVEEVRVEWVPPEGVSGGFRIVG